MVAMVAMVVNQAMLLLLLLLLLRACDPLPCPPSLLQQQRPVRHWQHDRGAQGSRSVGV